MRRFLRMGAAVATLCCGGGAFAQTAPVPIDPANWVTANDYPPVALRNGDSGAVRFEVKVDRAGKPVACRIVTSSNSAPLDTATCGAMMLRGAFQPATDALGVPIDGVWVGRFVWKMPESVTIIHEPLTSFVQVERLTFDSKGQARQCSSSKAGELSYRRAGCLKVAGDYVTALTLAGRYPKSVVTILIRQQVEGEPEPLNAPTVDLPPQWTVEQTFVAQPDGRISECTRRDSRIGAIPCVEPPRYLPSPDGKARRVLQEARWSVRPAQ